MLSGLMSIHMGNKMSVLSMSSSMLQPSTEESYMRRDVVIQTWLLHGQQLMLGKRTYLILKGASNILLTHTARV